MFKQVANSRLSPILSIVNREMRQAPPFHQASTIYLISFLHWRTEISCVYYYFLLVCVAANLLIENGELSFACFVHVGPTNCLSSSCNYWNLLRTSFIFIIIYVCRHILFSGLLKGLQKTVIKSTMPSRKKDSTILMYIWFGAKMTLILPRKWYVYLLHGNSCYLDQIRCHRWLTSLKYEHEVDLTWRLGL